MKNQIKPTIFETLALADMERIHTQMLSWIFNQRDSIIKPKHKSDILKALFSTKSEIEEFYDFRAHTEYKGVDILIEATTQSKKVIFVIENKLKSSESLGQTTKYETCVNSDFPKEDKYFCFLTLISESAQSPGWQNTSYNILYKSISNIDIDDDFISEKIFIKEYQATLKNLTTAYEMFSNNHREFKNVFTDGSKTKFSKRGQNHTNKYCKYISKNQLETIFQKYFFKTLFSNRELSKFIKINFQENIEFSETRGTALVQIKLKNTEKYTKDKKIYDFGCQLQGNTLKINFFDSDYDKSTKEQIKGVIENNFIAVFKGWNGYSRINRPRSKAYISASKDLAYDLWDYTLEDLANEIILELTEFLDAAKKFDLTEKNRII